MSRLIPDKIFIQKRNLTLLRTLWAKTKSTKTKSTNTSNPSAVNDNVPGLSKRCVDVPNTPVGPGAAKDKEYKNPEYFCYGIHSFGEAEVELAKYRLPVPSNKVPFNR